VGPFYTEAEAVARPFETRKVSTGERPYRRVVPSPEPVDVVEADEIASLVSTGALVICAGGGGVPVVRGDGLRGVEAVVDKDHTSRLSPPPSGPRPSSS
jgi:carbamate kinase